ncbi:MAG: protein kinase [Gemmataceae bacterium]
MDISQLRDPETNAPDKECQTAQSTPVPRGESPNRISTRYVLQERIAEGGIGAIYRAWDQRLNRVVAVKILLEDHPSPEEIRRFADEAHTLAQFSHPNIPPIYDFGILRAS